jgi:hypothetical protein
MPASGLEAGAERRRIQRSMTSFRQIDANRRNALQSTGKSRTGQTAVAAQRFTTDHCPWRISKTIENSKRRQARTGVLSKADDEWSICAGCGSRSMTPWFGHGFSDRSGAAQRLGAASARGLEPTGQLSECGWPLDTPACARALMAWRCWCERRSSAIRTKFVFAASVAGRSSGMCLYARLEPAPSSGPRRRSRLPADATR